MDVDYAMLIKPYGNDFLRYEVRPDERIGTQTATLRGCPDPKHISTHALQLPYSSDMRVTPAMQAGIANHVWNVEELVSLLGRVA